MDSSAAPFLAPLPVRIATQVLFYGGLVAVVAFDRAGRDTGLMTGESVPIRFREIGARAGLDFRHEPFAVDPKIRAIEPHVAGIGASIAVVDYDGDGKKDLYATSSRAGSANALFRNLGTGGFERVSGAAGLEGANSDTDGYSMGAVFADLDGDSDPECFLVKFGRQHLFENVGGRFEDVSERAGLAIRMNSSAATFLDHDRDGDLDLYVAGYFREEVDFARLETTRIMQESFEFAKNGGRNRMFRNEGGLRFVEVTDELGVGSTRWTLAVGAFDVDGDGWQDLYLANDYGPEELFLNRDGKRFEPAGARAGLSRESKSGMCVAVGDFTNTGVPSVFVSNICRKGYLFQGNNLRENRLASTGLMEDVAANNVKDCGWAWGAQFADLDNDGWQDLVVVNGFLSQSQEKDYWFDMSKIASATNDAFEDATKWPAIGNKSLSGYERSRVLWNRNGEQFRDVAAAAGVDDLLDGRGIAVADLFGRGRLDLIVANRAGPLLLYENVGAEGAHWIRFDLRGRGSNTDAIGACIRLSHAGGTTCHFVMSAAGFAAQNESTVHFGLGAESSVERATITWPSGRVQVIEDLAVDRVHVVEEPTP